MRPPRPRDLAARWLPRRTVRLRLTIFYGSLFLFAGALLLGITYVLVASNDTSGNFAVRAVRDGRNVTVVTQQVGGSLPVLRPPNRGPVALVASGQRLDFGNGPAVLPVPKALAGKAQAFFNAQLRRQHSNELSNLLLWSGTALGVMALLSVWLGWLMAGRVLAPLRRMTTTAREMSADNLHARLALDGPDDELRELGETFDALLARLENAFEAQRRFVANASHELRTPLTLERAMIEVALADPDADVGSLREVCERVLATGQQQERLLEALLTLARSERGLDGREPIDLECVVDEVLAATMAAAADPGPRVMLALAPAPVAGDQRLVERLAANLLDNATRHNVADGWVRVVTAVREGRGTLKVSNSGPRITAADLPALLEPFRRAAPARAHAPGSGQGLGLSIAAAIAAAHGAELQIHARSEGGLEVTVSFPPAPAAAHARRLPASPAAAPPGVPAPAS